MSTLLRSFRLVLLPVCAAALLLLSGCSALSALMVPGWTQDADLIVVNRCKQPIYSITVDGEAHSETVCDSQGFALLERGESWGFYAQSDSELLTVTLCDEGGRSLARVPLEFSGQRLVLALEEDGSTSVQAEENVFDEEAAG